MCVLYKNSIGVRAVKMMELFIWEIWGWRAKSKGKPHCLVSGACPLLTQREGRYWIRGIDRQSGEICKSWRLEESGGGIRTSVNATYACPFCRFCVSSKLIWTKHRVSLNYSWAQGLWRAFLGRERERERKKKREGGRRTVCVDIRCQ